MSRQQIRKTDRRVQLHDINSLQGKLQENGGAGQNVNTAHARTCSEARIAPLVHQGDVQMLDVVNEFQSLALISNAAS